MFGKPKDNGKRGIASQESIDYARSKLKSELQGKGQSGFFEYENGHYKITGVGLIPFMEKMKAMLDWFIYSKENMKVWLHEKSGRIFLEMPSIDQPGKIEIIECSMGKPMQRYYCKEEWFTEMDVFKDELLMWRVVA